MGAPPARRAGRTDWARRGLAALACTAALLAFASLFVEDLDDTDAEHVPAAAARPEPGPRAAADEAARRGAAPEPAAAPPRGARGRAEGKAAVRATPASALARDAPIATGYPFKVYVYDDVPDVLDRDLRDASHCRASYSAAELLLPDLFASSDVYTPEPELADYYVVPLVTDCYLSERLRAGVDFYKAVQGLNKAVQYTLDLLQSRHPYWARTEGRDHIFVFPSERGPSLLRDNLLERIRKSIFIVGLVKASAGHFNTWKDIVIPAARPAGRLEEISSRDRAARDTLLHFRGSVPGKEGASSWGLRSKLWQGLRAEPGVQFEEPTAGCGRDCTHEEMLRSRFCLCPAGGVEGWSLRLYDAVALGCVPVVVADDVELPFEAALDYAAFSVKLPESMAAGGMVSRLRALEGARLEAKQAALAAHRANFTFHDTWVAGDAFDNVLRELHARSRFMRNSPYRFWSAPLESG